MGMLKLAILVQKLLAIKVNNVELRGGGLKENLVNSCDFEG